MKLVPLTVTGPVSAGEEPKATVTLEATDELRYHVTPDPLPAGPQVWKFTNTGKHHAHHAMFAGIPAGVTAEQIVAEFQSMMAGTPPTDDSIMAQTTHPAMPRCNRAGRRPGWSSISSPAATPSSASSWTPPSCAPTSSTAW